VGLIDFVKDAGKKLFGYGDEPEPSINAEQTQKMANQKRAMDMVQYVKGLGFMVEDIDVSVSGEIVKIAGKVDSQEMREKIVLALGNTAGIAQVNDQLEVVELAPEAVYYTVVAGDTLYKISKQHYGKGMKYPVIFEANKPMLSNPDKIYPGQVLRIPPLED
jgi:nucleoid-associated protein YgaU